MNTNKVRAGTKVIGEVFAKTFFKRVEGSRHFLRRPPAICFDVDTLQEAQRLGAEWAKVVDVETGRIYRARITAIWENGFPVQRGHGDQIGLMFKHWTCDDDGQVSLPLAG